MTTYLILETYGAPYLTLDSISGLLGRLKRSELPKMLPT